MRSIERGERNNDGESDDERGEENQPAVHINVNIDSACSWEISIQHPSFNLLIATNLYIKLDL